jgi:hypothetical protein
MRTVERDPAARAALRRVQLRLGAITKAFQSLGLEQSQKSQQAAIARLAEHVRQALRDTGDELAARDLPTPTTLEDWEHLARIIEMPFDTIRSGDYTLRDVYVMALAWLDRQKILRGLASTVGASADRGGRKSERTFTVAALLEWSDLSNTALNKYAKLAGVRTPRRGQRNFRYSWADARKILETIIAEASDRRIRDKCRVALQNPPKITR